MINPQSPFRYLQSAIRNPKSSAVVAVVILVFSLLPVLVRAGSRPVLPGVDVFVRGHTGLVKGKKVGLVTNQTGVGISGRSTIDLLHRHPDVNLVAIFAPEHGLAGVVEAGDDVENSIHRGTGLPVYSLYGGGGHQPSAKVVRRLDVIIYDIQDVGSRTYTYVWSMAKVMEACADMGKAFIVLDRPNPLAPNRIDGPVLEDKWRSFIGLYPVPRVYGMTAGELARYINREHGVDCHLFIIPMARYRRSMTWKDTRLNWVAPSPNIPTAASAVSYAATGALGELGQVSIGIGTDWPFQIVAAPWLNAQASAAALNQAKLPGVKFRATQVRPKAGRYARRTVPALWIQVTNPSHFLPATTEVLLIHHLANAYPEKFEWKRKTFKIFDKAMGTDRVRKALMDGESWYDLYQSWKPAQKKFMERRARYLIYK